MSKLKCGYGEMIEVLRSKLYGLKLKRDNWVKSGTVLGMPNFIIDDINALTQAIEVLKRVADVEGVSKIICDKLCSESVVEEIDSYQIATAVTQWQIKGPKIYGRTVASFAQPEVDKGCLKANERGE